MIRHHLSSINYYSSQESVKESVEGIRKFIKEIKKNHSDLETHLDGILIKDDNCRNEDKFLTDFNKYRIYQLKQEFNYIKEAIDLLNKLYNKFGKSPGNEKFKFLMNLIIKNCFVKIKYFSKEPLCYFPDFHLWLIEDDVKPIGICTMKSSDIIWSENENERGLYSNRMIYTDVKSLRKVDINDAERSTIARIKISPWLGSADEVNNIFSNDYISNSKIKFTFTNHILVPFELFLKGFFYFEKF
jgi:hypothetical protein